MTNNQSKILTEEQKEDRKQKRKIYYEKNKEKINKYLLEYYYKNQEKYKKYHRERYKKIGCEYYNKNKKEILLKKRQQYCLEKNKPFLSLEEHKKKNIELPSDLPIVKSSCQAKTNEIIKNLELLKLKSEAFKKSLNDN